MSDEPLRPDFQALLEYLKQARGFDFTAYKPPSLMRRVDKRMQTVGITSYGDYLDYLQVHPEEFAHLFNTILINVTDFFRDEPAWEFLAQVVIPRMIESKRPDDPIRVWSAGSAAGQEAFSIAMLTAEALGDEGYRQRVKVYATDVDEEALNSARHGTYTAQQVQNVPAALRSKYFEQANDAFTFRRDLRRALIFGRNDLLQDAPISRVDLLACRNTLMYFNAEAQGRILSRFEFALNPGGYLFLGMAEVMLTRNSPFVPVELKHRIFIKALTGPGHPREPATAPTSVTEPGAQESPVAARRSPTWLHELAAELDPVPQVVADPAGTLVLANAQARLLFGLPRDLRHRGLQDLAIPYRPAELRLLAEQAMSEGRALSLKEVGWPAGNGKSYFDVHALAIRDPGGETLGVKIQLVDVTRQHQLREELDRLEEELKTTHEELQSTNEELETTNEELQSTNEELETTNEELQSTNAELDATNEELRHNNEVVQHLNTFLESILSGLRDGVAVVDRDLIVRAWNKRAEDLWGVRADEVRGQHFLGLDIGLPVEQLRTLIRSSLSEDGGFQEQIVSATNRRGRPVRIKVIGTRLSGEGDDAPGTILVMEEQKP